MRNKHPVLLLFILFISVLITIGTVAANAQVAFQAQTATHAIFASPTLQPVCPPDCAHIFSSLTNRFVVRLKVGFQKESSLSIDQVKSQRANIGIAQQEIVDLVASMQKSGVDRKVEIYVDGSSYLVILADIDFLKLLITNPKVERIFLDSPMNEAYDLGLGDIAEIDLDALYGSSIPTTTPNQTYSQNPGGWNYCLDGKCSNLLERAKTQGMVDIEVILHWEKQYTFFRHGSAEERAQQAIIRLTVLQFLKKYGSLIQDFGGPSPYAEVTMRVSYEGLLKLLDDPMISVIDPLPERTYPFGLPRTPNRTNNSNTP